MIATLTESLYNVVSDFNIMIERGFYSAQFQEHYKALEASISDFKKSREVLYKELFEPWCKVDFCRFCRLTNRILNHSEEWQEKALRISPDFPILLNELCLIYDEMEQRAPELVEIAERDDSDEPTGSTDQQQLEKVENVERDEPSISADTPGLNGQTSTPTSLPENSPERAKRAFEMALKDGFMEKTATGYKWLYNGGSKACLAYFLAMVYNPDNSRITPFTLLERLFNVKRLDRAAEQATTAKNPQWWRECIDKLLQEI